MFSRSKVPAVLMAVILGTSALSPLAMAEEVVSTSAVQSDGVVKTSSLDISPVGKDVLTSIYNARLAIFDGKVDDAKKMISDASDKLNKDLTKFLVKQDQAVVLPVDSGIRFKDGYTPDKDHAQVLAEAGKLINNGQVETAVDNMVKAGIELNIQVAMLPYQQALTGLTEAQKDISAGHVQKANMTLKSIETSVSVADFQPGQMPSQGVSASDIKSG